MSGTNDVIDAILVDLDDMARAASPRFELPAGGANAARRDRIRHHLENLRPKQAIVEARSIFGQKTRQPYVELLVPDGVVAQWSPEQARHHALVVLGAAEAAEQDAFLVKWFENLEPELRGGAIERILQDYRGFRAAQREVR